MMPITEQVRVSLADNRNALRSREVRTLFEDTPPEVLVTVPWFGCEAAYFLAHKYNASLGQCHVIPTHLTPPPQC